MEELSFTIRKDPPGYGMFEMSNIRPMRMQRPLLPEILFQIYKPWCVFCDNSGIIIGIGDREVRCECADFVTHLPHPGCRLSNAD